MKRPPLFVFAFDAGDPGLLSKWASDGILPNVSDIMQQGFWGRTAGPDLINEHGAFVSLFSGVSCAEHGYYYSRQLRPGTYDLFTTTSQDAHTHPFWHHLRRTASRVAIIDVPDTMPIAGLPGLQLCDWATHNPRLPPAAEPPELLAEVRKFFGPQIPISEDPKSTVEHDRRLLRNLLERIEKKGALCRHLLRHGAFDLVAVGFAESHPAAHQFWPYFVGQKEGGDELADGIPAIYRAIDRELGTLLKLLPPDSNRFVVSSVGIQEQYPIFHVMEDLCRKLGYQAAPSRGRASFKPMHLVRRFIPESWRIGVSRHFSRETRERLLADQFRGRTDWGGTSMFAIPSSFTGLLRVNLRGREPQGTVEPGAAYRQLLDQVANDLRQIIDPVTGETAVDDVVITVDRFGGGPPASLPDIFVLWKPARHFMDRLQHPHTDLTQERPEFSRDTHHSQNGFVTGAGPDVVISGEHEEVPLLDLAPTFLSLLGAPIPESLNGTLLRETARHA